MFLCIAIAADALCPDKDAGVIGAVVAFAMEAMEEDRGRGISRAPWGFLSFPRQQDLELFRFTRDEIEDLMDALQFPPDEYWLTTSGSQFTREEAMLLFLRRMSYPTKLTNLTNEGFHAQIGALSELYTMVAEWIYTNHTSRLLCSGLIHWKDRVPLYAAGVERYTGIPLECFGFIDGTARAISRPSREQRAFYSGHKRGHRLQFMSIVAPDGMLIYSAGPTNGAHQDNWLVHESKLVTDILPGLAEELGHVYCIYGDPIYARSVYLQKGFPTVERTWREQILNQSMNSARVAVEHAFNRVIALWAFVDFAKQQKSLCTRPAMAYLNAQFLTNCNNCMYPNQVSQAFDIEPPTLREYISLGRGE